MNHDDKIDELNDVRVDYYDEVLVYLEDGVLVPPHHPCKQVAEEEEEKEQEEEQGTYFKFYSWRV